MLPIICQASLKRQCRERRVVASKRLGTRASSFPRSSAAVYSGRLAARRMLTAYPCAAETHRNMANRRAVEKTYIGTAAWTNPPAERPARATGQSHLQHYATRFNAVEINSSFYRPHERGTYRRWAESTPAAFGFSVKAPRSVTHESGLRHCRVELRQFLEEVAGLGQKLRVILVQTPASLAFEARVVGRFFASLTSAGLCRIVCEPRHPSWFTPRAEAALSRHGVS